MDTLFRCRSMAAEYSGLDLMFPGQKRSGKGDFNINRMPPEYMKLFERAGNQTVKKSNRREIIKKIGTILSKDWKPSKSLFSQRRPLGRGSYGVVEKGIHIPTGQVMAKKTFFPNPYVKENVVEEAMWMKRLGDTGYAPKCFGISLDDPQKPAILQEYLKGYVTLHTLLYRKRKLTEEQRLQIALETAKAIKSFHKKGIYHNDIKSDNIMVDLRQPNNPKVKVIDFGNASDLPITIDIEPALRDKYVHIAPELRNGFPSCDTSDVHSFGELLRKLGKRSKMADVFQSVVDMCTECSPRKRPSMEAVCSHLEAIFLNN